MVDFILHQVFRLVLGCALTFLVGLFCAVLYQLYTNGWLVFSLLAMVTLWGVGCIGEYFD